MLFFSHFREQLYQNNGTVILPYVARKKVLLGLPLGARRGVKQLAGDNCLWRKGYVPQGNFRRYVRRRRSASASRPFSFLYGSLRRGRASSARASDCRPTKRAGERTNVSNEQGSGTLLLRSNANLPRYLPRFSSLNFIKPKTLRLGNYALSTGGRSLEIYKEICPTRQFWSQLCFPEKCAALFNVPSWQLSSWTTDRHTLSWSTNETWNN